MNATKRKQDGLWNEFAKGLFAQNPIFVIVLGLCPTLAVSVSIEIAIGMGAAASFVLLASNIVIAALMALFGKILSPGMLAQVKKIRIPIYIVIIASFVTIVDLLMNGFAPALYAKLGLYVPLIVVNCIILARAEAYAYKNGVLNSAADGLGMGVGFTLALIILATIREPIATGKILAAADFGFAGIKLFPAKFAAALIEKPVGGFMTLGFVLAAINGVTMRRQGKLAEAASCGCTPKEV